MKTISTCTATYDEKRYTCYTLSFGNSKILFLDAPFYSQGVNFKIQLDLRYSLWLIILFIYLGRR